MRKNKFMIYSTVIFIFLQIIIALLLFKNKQYMYIYEVLFTTLFIIIYTFIEIKYNLHLSNYTRFFIILTILAHTFIGDYLNLYVKSFIFDKILHTIGTYSFTLLGYSLINQISKKPYFTKPYEFIFILCLGVTLGEFFELIEFSIDIVLKPQIPSQGNVIDTNIDMIFNTIGAIVAGLHRTLLRK